MSLTDYSKIKEIIDDIVGVNTKQGNNLKRAIKNYFDNKPVNVKLASRDFSSFSIKKISKYTDQAKKALVRYNEKLKKETELLKKKGEYCGVSG